jgi:hypothetical protein
MRTVSPTALQSGQVIDNIEALLGSRQNNVGVLDWQNPQNHINVITPHELSFWSHEMLRGINYEDLSQLIASISGNADSPELLDVLSAIKRKRKLFSIARDGIILSSRGAPDPRYDSLFALCRSLNKIADTAGQDPTYIFDASEHAANLQATVPDSQPLKNQQELNEATLAMLQPPNHLAAGVNYKQYHSLRKNFRRVVHLQTLRACAQIDDPELFAFAVAGIRLNLIYGKIKDNFNKA